ncbi:hypothetical protein [Mangrovibacterium sp.]|uniref:hypothetical protein n=1 Tax=Mangrovibacterium sp. TaxID=1961364 RepID=UPI0035663757
MEIRIEKLWSTANMMLIVSIVVLLTIGMIDLLPDPYAVWNSRFLGLGLLLSAIFYLKLFRKNYIVYTSKMMMINCGRLSRKFIRFNQLVYCEIENGLLKIELKSGEQLVIDMDEADQEKLHRLDDLVHRKTNFRA